MLTPSETSYFSEPSSMLDPRLFRNNKLQSTVRAALLQLLFNHLNKNYTGGEYWSYVWLAGSGVSYQWAANRDPGDLDCLVGIDYRRFRESNNRYAGLSDKEIAQTLNEKFREELHPISAYFLGEFELTFYVNVRTNITDIKPYAAYSVTDDNWTVEPSAEPVVIDESWKFTTDSDLNKAIDILTAYHAADSKYQAATNPAVKSNARSERKVAASQAIALYNEIHEGRNAAFSPSGKGYADFFNYRWQANKQSGVVQALRALKTEVEAEDAELAKSTYGVDLPDANTLIRRAASRRTI